MMVPSHRQVPRRLIGKTALVTGAARRVGRAIARALAEEGADLAVHYHRSKAEAAAACAEFRQLGVRADSFNADLADAHAAAGLVGRVVSAFGRLDVCVPSASVFFPTPFEQITAEVWDRFMAINLRSVFQVCQAAGLHMQNSQGGAIVTIGDWAGLRPYAGYLPYCISKAGVIALTQALAGTLAPRVRVNCVCPGPVLPPEHFSPQEIEQVRREVPLQAIGTPEDIAEAVRFLVCGTDFATGAVLTIDGGRLIS